MMVLEKRLCPSAKISHTVSCNISLYRDTKEVIYRYTQNVYRCISNPYFFFKIFIFLNNPIYVSLGVLVPNSRDRHEKQWRPDFTYHRTHPKMCFV